MKTFREYVSEGLSYKSTEDEVSKFKNIDSYKTETKGTTTIYIKDNETVFTFDTKTKKLIVLKHKWQKMNLERGF